MTKRLTEILILGAFLIISIGLYKSTADFPEMVQGSTANYIRFLAVSLGILCLVEAGLWMRKKHQDQGKKLNMTAAPFRFWSLLILMFVYSLLLEYLGFYVTSALFLPMTMFVLGARKVFLIALTSGGVLLFVFLVFGKILGVPLPESSLF
jgi:putative tricarboxylic transport membrane protein